MNVAPPNTPLSSKTPGGLSSEAKRALLQVALFAFVAWSLWHLIPLLMPPPANGLVAAALSTFGAGVTTNLLIARLYEQGRVASFGMAWSRSSARELLIGTAGGASGAAAIFLLGLAARLAVLERVPTSGNWPVSLAFILIALALGAVGEELLFRGYAFQMLIGTVGEFAAVLPVSVLFGIAHMGNRGVTPLAIFNTVVWGVLLGYAFLLTRALWLPIGLHFGWNAAMPLLGVNLSGFTMGVPGYALRWNAGDLWSGGPYGFEGSLMTTAVVVILFFVLRRAIPRRDGEPESI